DNDSFIAHWLGRLIFYENFDEGDWSFLIGGYLIFTALVVLSFWKAPPRLPMTTASFVGLVHASICGILFVSTWSSPLGIWARVFWCRGFCGTFGRNKRRNLKKVVS